MKRSSMWTGVLAALVVAGTARAEYSVLTAHEGVDVRLFSVSDDGGKWSLKRVFKTGAVRTDMYPCTVATDGAFVYIGEKKATSGDQSWIQKYHLDGTYVGELLDLSSTCRLDSITVDPQGEWIYVCAGFGDDGSKKNRVYRYRLSNPSEGGAYITSGLNTPRQITFGPDGLLYVANRGSSVVLAYDVSGTTPGLVRTFSAGNQGGVAIDDTSVRVLATDAVTCFDRTNAESKVSAKVSNLTNPFCSVNLGGTSYLGGYSGGRIFRCETNGTYTLVATTSDKLSGLCRVPMPIAHYRFEEPANASRYTNAMDAAAYPIHPYGDLRSGAAGAEGNGLWFSSKAVSRGIIQDSIGLIDQTTTNDFSICFWAGLRSNYNGERILLSDNWGNAERCAIAVNLGSVSGKVSFFHPAGSSTHLTSTSRVDDAKWHHIGVVRRSGRSEIWVDGRLEASQADKGSMLQKGNWMLGSLNGDYNRIRDGVMDDVRFYRFALAPRDIEGIVAQTAPADRSLPTTSPADPSAPDHTAAEAFGTVVRHRSMLEGPLGVQTLVIGSDGTYWAASGSSVAGSWGDSATVICKSTDRGANWQIVSTNTSLSQGSLTLVDGKFCLVGVPNAYSDYGKARFATSSDGTSWTTYATQTGIDSARGRVLAHDGTYWVGTTQPGVLGFTLTDGSPTITTASSFMAKISAGRSWGFTKGYLPPTLFVRDGAVRALVPSMMKSSTSYTEGPGYVLSFACAAGGATAQQSFTLPGGSKTFDMVYDAVSAQYWAVSMPERSVARVAAPTEVNHVLALYASANGTTWQHVTDIVTTTFGEKGFVGPSLAIDGDDLAILFGASVPDGSVNPSWTTDANYLLFRKVANFRSLTPEKIDTHRFLLVTDTTANGVARYYPGKEGNWIFGGYAVTNGTYGGLKLDKAHAVAWSPDALYVNNMDGTNVFEFAHDGTFRRMVADFWTADYSQAIDNILLSRDRRYLYCTDMVKRHCIWRIDLATLEKTEWVTAESEIVTGVRGFVAMRDGSVVAADRMQNRVIRLNADGSLAATLVESTAGLRKPQALCYDARNDLFYVDSNDGGCTYSFPNQTGASITKVAPYHSFSLTMLDGTVYSSIWEDGTVLATVPDPLTTAEGKRVKRALLATGLNCSKILGVEIPDGTIIMLR